MSGSKPKSLQWASWMASLVGALIVVACSDSRIAGSGSVTTNGFTGTVTQGGTPASGIKVALYPETYSPLRETSVPDPRKDTTDAAGHFHFDSVEAGAYNIIASRGDGGTAVLIAGMTVAKDDSLIKLPDAALQPVGKVELPLSESARVSGGFYLPGTDIYSILDSTDIANGSVALEAVPAATYPALLYLAPGADSGRNVLSGPLVVSPGGSATVNPFALWKRAYRVTVDLSPSGADVAEDLYGFPLLVRLDAGNFDFASALTDGADLRVTKSDSVTALPLEIESWDAQARTAEVWVRVDTLRSGNASQFFCLYAGREGVSPVSNGPAVFDTASGYKGVWHLGESPVGNRGVIRDRTANGFHGSPGGAMTSEALVQGIVGKGLVLDGKNDFIELPASNQFIRQADQSLTLSAWVRPDSLAANEDSVRHRILSFKTDTMGLSSLAWGINSKGTFAHYTRDSDTLLNWSSKVTAAGIYHVALTFENGRFVGYVNGEVDVKVTGLGLFVGGIQPVMVGTHIPGDRQFQGLMDELRIEKSSRSGGWVRLSFESQKPGAAVAKLSLIR